MVLPAAMAESDDMPSIRAPAIRVKIVLRFIKSSSLVTAARWTPGRSVPTALTKVW